MLVFFIVFITLAIVIANIIARPNKRNVGIYNKVRSKTAVYKSKSVVQGDYLEAHVNRDLSEFGVQYGGKTFLDMLYSKNGHTIQIDNILVTRKAIYVIEAKNYSGWIFGSENYNTWTQTFTHYKARTSGNNYSKSGVSKYRFQNPIKQNITHINMIKNLTNAHRLMPIYNIVVFGREATLKDIKHNSNNYIIKIYELEGLIKNINSSLTKAINFDDFNRITNILFKSNIIDTYQRRKHVQSIKVKYNS